MGIREKSFKIKEIYWVNFEGKDHVQNGIRPAVIIQNDKGNHYSNTIVVVPITSAIKANLPTHVHIGAGNFGLIKNSTVQCEGERVVSKEDIGNYIGCIDDATMRKIALACLVNTPLLSYMTMGDAMKMIGKKGCKIKIS